MFHAASLYSSIIFIAEHDWWSFKAGIRRLIDIYFYPRTVAIHSIIPKLSGHFSALGYGVSGGKGSESSPLQERPQLRSGTRSNLHCPLLESHHFHDFRFAASRPRKAAPQWWAKINHANMICLQVVHRQSLSMRVQWLCCINPQLYSCAIMFLGGWDCIGQTNSLAKVAYKLRRAGNLNVYLGKGLSIWKMWQVMERSRLSLLLLLLLLLLHHNLHGPINSLKVYKNNTLTASASALHARHARVCNDQWLVQIACVSTHSMHWCGCWRGSCWRAKVANDNCYVYAYFVHEKAFKLWLCLTLTGTVQTIGGQQCFHLYLHLSGREAHRYRRVTRNYAKSLSASLSGWIANKLTDL